MSAIQRKLVHKQFNSPLGLYSQQNVKETLNRELNAFGANGIESDDQIPLNLANSAVLRAVEEDEQQQMKCAIQPKLRNLNTTDTTRESMERTTNSQQHEYQAHHPQQMSADTMLRQTSVINRSFDNVSPRPYITIEGYKRVAWPPASEERLVREFTPQPQTQYQPVPAYQQQQSSKQQEPGAAVPSTQGPIYNNVQQQQQHHQHPAPTNTNNFVRETISPYNQNQNQYEPYPPQQPETPIVLVDKQFGRQASHEPIQTNSASYQQQQSPMVQPQSQPMQQQNQPTYNQQIYQQQYQPNNQQNVSYPQQQQEYQQPPLQQQNSPSTPVAGWKPIHAPQPKQESCFTKPLVVGANDSLTYFPTYQQQFQNYHQQPQYQQEPQQQQQQQQYRAPSHDTYQQPQKPQYQQPPQQQQQYSPQSQYQAPAPTQQQYQGQPQQVSQHHQQQQQPQGQVQPQYQPQSWAPQTQQGQQQYPQPPWVQQPQQPAQQQYQQPPWVQQHQQQQPPQQQYQQPQYQTPLNQYQAPHQQYQPQPQQNQFVSQPNQQFNSYSQPQQQQHTVSHDQLDNLQQPRQQTQSLLQDYRGASPGIITLRKEAPVTQPPAPVYTSQPAAVSFMELSTDDILGGSNMRGDLKWPPPEYKEAAVKENQERRELAAGPVCRPRQVKRDYTKFFAKNALSHHYPSYKVPPGTQHMTY